MERIKTIKARECLEFNLNSKDEEEALKYFFRTYESEINIIKFNDRECKNDSLILSKYDYKTNKFMAGRLVGSSRFLYKNKKYEIVIEPRYGKMFLFKMLEEIFNIKIFKDKGEAIKKETSEGILRKIISFIWIKKLSLANKHGFPQINIKKENTSYLQKGRLLINKTIIPYYTEGKLVSQSYEKQNDIIIAKILYQAY